MIPVSVVPLMRRAVMSDEAHWLEAARRGEPWALTRCYEAYHQRVYGLCYRLLGRADDAQDAMQTTFVNAFRDLPRFRGDGSLRNWLFRIGVNVSNRLLRERRDGVELTEEIADVADDAPGVVERIAVRAALARMRPANREVLILRFWEELSYEEIALVLGRPVSLVKMRLHRARQEFRSCYERE